MLLGKHSPCLPEEKSMDALNRDRLPPELEAPSALEPELARVIEALEEGVLVLEDGRIVRVNDALARMVGSPPEELTGQALVDLLTDAEGRPHAEPSAGQACRLRSARGDLVPVTLRPVTDRVYLLADRSRERRLEGEVWRLTNRLRGEGGAEPADDPSGAEFFGMLEHEIRTAATVVSGYTRLLLDERVGAINATQRAFLQESRKATERISSLLDNLLELSSLQCPTGMRVVRKPVQLHEVLRSAVEALRPVLDDRRLEVALELDAAQDLVQGDFTRLEQVALNLLANAGKFSPEGTRIRIATALCDGEEGQAILVSVDDEGPGVTSEERERIFRPFVQGEAAAGSVRSAGVGLGLAICRKILETHAGSIEAVPSLGHGLFRFTLPLSRLRNAAS
jgi:signal transduction histidine kinase